MKDKHTNEIIQELQSIGPILAQIPKRTPNNVPENYFENVEENILSQCLLLAYEKSLNVTVPSEYFDNIEDEIITTIENLDVKQTSKTPVRQMFFRKRWMQAVAAIFVLALGTWFVFNKMAVENKPTSNIVADPDMYLRYIHDHIDEFNIDMLLDHDLVEESDISIVDFKFLDDMDDPSNLMDSEIHF